MDIETDERCMDLAKHFLSGGTAKLGEPQDCLVNHVSLARHIQAAVDDWFLMNAPSEDSAVGR